MKTYSDQEILNLVDQYMHASDHPDHVAYRNHVKKQEFADRQYFLDQIRALAKLGDFYDKRILDVGCGFGWQAFTFALMGNRVVGLDVLPSMIDGMNDSIAAMKRSVKFDLQGICGDICGTQLENGSFDAIYSHEAIEHVRDLPAMFERCRKLLKPGGKLILIDDLNVFNRVTRQDMMAMWEKRDTSWEFIAQLKEWRPIEHSKAEPFAVTRERIARNANSGLSDSAIEDIVQNTAGLMKDQIETIARDYRAGMRFPHVGEFDRCRNPETGEYIERLLDPFNLADMLTRMGFKTQVRHYFRRLPYRLLNGIGIRPINKLIFSKRGMFVIVGSL